MGRALVALFGLPAASLSGTFRGTVCLLHVVPADAREG